MTCDHPAKDRWQGRGFWQCCRCWRWFHGDKRENPETDVYGKPFLEEVKG